MTIFSQFTGLCALPMTVVMILIDSIYFGYLTWHEILQKKISLESNFVMTPYNFIQYNMYTSNLANHGLHPRITHVLLNMPLLYNVLALAAFSAVISLLYRLVQSHNTIMFLLLPLNTLVTVRPIETFGIRTWYQF